MNIQWYPGHMTKTRRQMENDVKLVDLVAAIARMGRPICPLAFHATSLSFKTCFAAEENCPTPLPLLASVSSTSHKERVTAPFLLK